MRKTDYNIVLKWVLVSVVLVMCYGVVSFFIGPPVWYISVLIVVLTVAIGSYKEIKKNRE